jgi:hypothetical protein
MHHKQTDKDSSERAQEYFDGWNEFDGPGLSPGGGQDLSLLHSVQDRL